MRGKVAALSQRQRHHEYKERYESGDLAHYGGAMNCVGMDSGLVGDGGVKDCKSKWAGDDR